jgi:hypothetical protein
MKRLIPIVLFVTYLTPVHHAEALTCRQVAQLNEQLRVASITNPKYGLNTKASIAFTFKVYQARYQNQSCVTSEQVSTVVDVAIAIQSACKVRKSSEPGYKEWKKWERDFWVGQYGRNFSYACTLWNGFRF